MKKELNDVLACPEDHASLNLEITKQTNAEIEEGTLTCTSCNRIYQIQGKIPILYFNEKQTVPEKWWELSGAPLVDYNFMRGIDPHQQPIRVRIRDEAIAVGTSVLDVGCATTIDYPLYKEKNFRYVGVDITFELLEGALQNTPDVPVVRGDGAKLPFKTESFDSCYCKDMMVHLPPEAYIKVLTEMWRITKKALMIGFFGNAVDTNKECIYELNPVNPKVGYNHPHWWSYYTREAIEDVLSKQPNFDRLIIDHVDFEGHENTVHKRTFYKALKKQTKN
jgi:uncharacterized protein YbaR (Trm112 family)/ubiquinone/menaquinone biosynthesis C-methylase UbiE